MYHKSLPVRDGKFGRRALNSLADVDYITIHQDPPVESGCRTRYLRIFPLARVHLVGFPVPVSSERPRRFFGLECRDQDFCSRRPSGVRVLSRASWALQPACRFGYVKMEIPEESLESHHETWYPPRLRRSKRDLRLRTQVPHPLGAQGRHPC